MVSTEVYLAGLLAVNVALYIPLIFSALKRRRQKVHASNLTEAFTGLALALRSAVPDLPAGFTWEEAVSRLKSSGVQTKGMEDVLRRYEEYRYGGSPLPDLDFHEVVKLANALGGISSGSIGGAGIGR